MCLPRVIFVTIVLLIKCVSTHGINIIVEYCSDQNFYICHNNKKCFHCCWPSLSILTKLRPLWSGITSPASKAMNKLAPE